MCNVMYQALPEITAARHQRQLALGQILRSFNLLAMLRRWHGGIAIPN